MKQYFNEISRLEKILCEIVNFIVSTSKFPKSIRSYVYKKLLKYSNRKYKRKHSLFRYYLYTFQHQFIGKYTYGFEDVLYENINFIGAFTSIAKYVNIVPNDHKTEWVTTSPILAVKDFGFTNKDLKMDYCPSEKRKVIIGNDVWIGSNCIIFEGVTIGDGAVIAAGSIIRRDVPPYAIVVSVDKIVKYRFSAEIIEKLLKIKWWDWSDEKIKENLNLFYKPEEFVEKFYKEEQ